MFRHALRLLPLVLAGALAACATDGKAIRTPGVALTPVDQYPLQAERRDGELRLAARLDGLSPAQRSALAGLADHWLNGGGGPVVVHAPLRNADQEAVLRTSGAAIQLLAALGVPTAQLRREGYDPTGEGPAPIVVSFTAYEAVIPTCGRSWENLSTNGKNRPMSNFGCAVNANLAAQMADPADIVAARASDPTDAGRRTTVIEKYRQGASTAGAKEAGASGAVSAASTGGGSN